MLMLNDGRSELWQWDTGRKLTVDADCSQVHFSNKVFGRSIDVDVVDGIAIIPDILLQTDKELTAWAFVGTAENGYTKISNVFKVNKRNKPADYVFTPPEQTTLAGLIARLDAIEESQDPDAIKNAVEDYLEQNPVEAPVESVNGKTGEVKLTAEDVGAISQDDLLEATNEALAQAKASGEFDGKNGEDGDDGITPHIGNNGNWFVGETDTGKPSRGADGKDGKDGAQGEQGIQGEKGEKGDKGDTGATGASGKDGSDGKDGTSATHSWNGTVLTITSASGTSSADLKGAKGDKGDQGIQGIQGDKGDKGDTGGTGANGKDGTSVTVKSVSESPADGGSNVVTFSDGKTVTIKNGSKGSPGATPVKGTDYFTDADKAEMVEDVKASMDGIPPYWQTALYNGVEAINTALCEAGRNKSAFLFYSDAHWNQNSQMSPKLLKHLYKNTGMTKTFFGGDIVNNEASDYDTMKYIWDWRNQIKDLPNHHSVVGNHDDGNATNNLFTEQYVYGYLFAAEETYDMVMGDGLYYYIDNPAEKTRYICLDTAFQTSEEKQTQMLSFLTEALKSTKSGWHIVVVSHIWYLPDYNQYDVKPIPIVGMSTEATAVCNVLDNYNARSGDFTDCGAKVEFCIGGHVHRDYVGTTTGGISIILVETDSQHIRSEFTYTAGTTTESSVNGVVADYNTNKVNIVRVGRGNSFVVDLSSGGTSDPDEPDTPAYTNLFVKSEAHDDYRLNSSGILTASSGDLVTGFISVQPNTSYTIRTYNKSNPYKSAIGRLSEYSAANESNHVVQYRVSEHEDHYYEGVTCVFPFTTSATTKFIRLNMAAGKGGDFIITLNEPIE